MSVQPVTLNLSDTIYRRMQQVAVALNRPLEEIVLQSIQGNLPPVLADLPPDLQPDLRALQSKSDQALWKVAKTQVLATQWKRHQELLEKRETEDLSPDEATELVTLRQLVDDLVMRRSYALALLKWRGHAITPLLAPSAD